MKNFICIVFMGFVLFSCGSNKNISSQQHEKVQDEIVSTSDSVGDYNQISNQNKEGAVWENIDSNDIDDIYNEKNERVKIEPMSESEKKQKFPEFYK